MEMWCERANTATANRALGCSFSNFEVFSGAQKSRWGILTIP
jgi:hypothetical protein